jgi:hydroxymethylpyrimidine/phosphomethylpyrimidine kinase
MKARAPRVLVVAGHDPSGAGLDADLDALRAFPVEALAIASARTDQDEHGVRAIGARDPEAWLCEALSAADERVGALKLGLLPGAEHVEAAARLVDLLRERWGDTLPVVLDPVLAASSGGRFLDARAVERLRTRLLAGGVVVTPNLPEAAELAGMEEHVLAERLGAREAAARALLALGARAVVLKGGHGREDPALDLVLDRDGARWLAHPRLPGAKLRGSGCRFASALAAGLALGAPLDEAAERAAELVHARLVARTRGAG